MADTRKKDEDLAPDKAAKEAAQAVDPPEDAESFPVERLIEEGTAFLGHPGHVVAGALHGISKKSLTVAEAKAACDKWLKSPVKEG